MVLPWTRRRRAEQMQARTEEQLSTATGQLMEVGEIIGRLNAVATRFEDAATRIVEACLEETDKTDETRKNPQP